jgi:hypothetical protein
MDAVVDRFIVGPKARKGDQGGDRRHPAGGRRTDAGRSAQRRGKAEAERFYKGLCSRTHHFVYGGIEPEYFMFNNPESACRTCGGLGVHKTHASRSAGARSASAASRRLLRARGVQVQSRHLGRPHDVQPVKMLPILARNAVGEAAGDGAPHHPLRPGGQETRDRHAAGRQGQARRVRRARKSASAGSRGASNGTTAATGSAAKPTRGWRRGSTR